MGEISFFLSLFGLLQGLHLVCNCYCFILSTRIFHLRFSGVYQSRLS